MDLQPDFKDALAKLARAKVSYAALGGFVLVVGCGAKPEPMVPGAANVVVSKDAPPAGYLELQPLTVQSGKGCGVFGQSGSREEAEAKLRNAAQRLGASYVRVTDEQAPRPNHECIEHEYKLSGVAYRTRGRPAPVAATTAPVAATTPPATIPPTTTPPAAPERACIPGATQACLGPGACHGAQACRDDASGFLPCDCGPQSSANPPAAAP